MACKRRGGADLLEALPFARLAVRPGTESPAKDFPNPFATPAHIFRRNSQMDNTLQTQAEMKELNYEKFFGYSEGAETHEGTRLSYRKSADKVLSMIVLLLVCLGLAALAHVVV